MVRRAQRTVRAVGDTARYDARTVEAACARLQQAADHDDSTLGYLSFCRSNQSWRDHVGSRTNTSVMNDALMSNDSVIVREASGGSLAQLNDGSPDAEVRAQALLAALTNRGRGKVCASSPQLLSGQIQLAARSVLLKRINTIVAPTSPPA